MAIDLPPPPDGTFSVVADGLAEIALGTPQLAAIGGAEPRPAPKPFPIYLIERRQVSANLVVERDARLIGWRFLIDADEDSFADVHLFDATGRQAFGGRQTGRPATLLGAAANMAAGLGETQNYEARILKVPALHVVVLWLYATVPLFLPILPEQWARAPLSEDALKALLISLLPPPEPADSELGG